MGMEQVCASAHRLQIALHKNSNLQVTHIALINLIHRLWG